MELLKLLKNKDIEVVEATVFLFRYMCYDLSEGDFLHFCGAM